MSGLLHQPIGQLFAEPRRVLVAGAGGGFDIIAGLGVALGLQELGHHVELANLSFTPLRAVEGGRWLDDVCLQVTADSTCREGYAPELHLAKWFRDSGEQRSIYCFRKVGAAPLAASYRVLIEELSIDTLVLVDGGVDAVLRGDEHSLGTPTLDHISVAATSTLELPRKLVASIGFGAERYDKIAHSQALHRFAELAGAEALLGVEAMLRQSPIGKRWLAALDYVHARQGIYTSIVSCTIAAAMRGEFGDTVVNARTEQTPIWVSPLAALCWYFELAPIASAKAYMSELVATETVAQAAELIDAYHQRHASPFESIPI